MINIINDFLIRVITFDYFVIRRTILKFVNKSSHLSSVKVLDVGCGTGALTKHFSKAGYLGFDIDKKSIEIAKSRNPGYKFLVADATKPLLKKHKFVLIIVSGVIHHLSNDNFNKTLKNISTYLAKNGKLIIVEAIPPINSWNIVGNLLRNIDQGHYIRPVEGYVQTAKKYFKVITYYQQAGGLVDYGVIFASF